MKIKGTYLLVLVAMCGLLASGIGLVTNIAGLFFDPVATEIGVSKGQVSLMLTICNICFALGGMVAPAFMRARSPKPLLIAATAALAASTVGLSLCHGIWAMYALCVVRGLAAGVVGMVFATTVLGNWFVEGLGLVTSIAFGCSGIAGAIFSPVMSAIIGIVGWRAAYVVVGALTVLLNLPAILFLPAVEPTSCGQRALGASAETEAKGAAKSGQNASGGSGGAISAALFCLVLVYAILCSGLTALPQHFPGIAESFGVGVVGAPRRGGAGDRCQQRVARAGLRRRVSQSSGVAGELANMGTGVSHVRVTNPRPPATPTIGPRRSTAASRQSSQLLFACLHDDPCGRRFLLTRHEVASQTEGSVERNGQNLSRHADNANSALRLSMRFLSRVYLNADSIIYIQNNLR